MLKTDSSQIRACIINTPFWSTLCNMSSCSFLRGDLPWIQTASTRRHIFTCMFIEYVSTVQLQTFYQQVTCVSPFIPPLLFGFSRQCLCSPGYRQGWPPTKRSTYLCLLNAGIQGVRYHSPVCLTFSLSTATF